MLATAEPEFLHPWPFFGGTAAIHKGFSQSHGDGFQAPPARAAFATGRGELRLVCLCLDEKPLRLATQVNLANGVPARNAIPILLSRLPVGPIVLPCLAAAVVEKINALPLTILRLVLRVEGSVEPVNLLGAAHPRNHKQTGICVL